MTGGSNLLGSFLMLMISGESVSWMCSGMLGLASCWALGSLGALIDSMIDSTDVPLDLSSRKLFLSVPWDFERDLGLA